MRMRENVIDKEWKRAGESFLFICLFLLWNENDSFMKIKTHEITENPHLKRNNVDENGDFLNLQG